MILTYQYPLKPNKSDLAKFEWVLEQDRILYNAALQERIDYYEKVGKKTNPKTHISYHDQAKSLTIIRNSDPYFEAGHVSRQRGPLNRVDKAFKNFRRDIIKWKKVDRAKGKPKPGFPKFKRKYKVKSFEVCERFYIRNKRFSSKDFPDGIKIHWTRDLPHNLIKFGAAIIRKTAKGWQLNVQCHIPDVEQKIIPQTAVGIDVGINSIITTSDGVHIAAKNFYRESEKKLRVLQRKRERCKRGSRNRLKINKQIGRLHHKVFNQRKNFLHTEARKLVDGYDIVVVEDLLIKNLVRNKKLAKSIYDQSWDSLFRKINYKADIEGKQYVEVNPRNTSQDCSGCGNRVKKRPSQRVHKCGNCGLVLDRDHNAAINILNKGANPILAVVNATVPTGP